MKNFKKKMSLVGVVAGLSLVSVASVSAWGPERAEFTMDSPATYPVFNSIKDNPTIGDERDFVRVGEIDAEVTELGNEVEVVPGRQYLVYVYFHNNASSTFNDSAHNHSGVALKTRMATSFSTVLTPAERGTITATITADNTNPLSVWDEAYMTTSTEKVLLHYVAGSAKIYNDWGANGSVMPSSLFTEEGALIGLNALNGVIPGCDEYHGVVSYVLQAEELGGTITKTVSSDGENYREGAVIAPDEEVYFQLEIQNTGDVALTNATVRDNLPDGLELVPGSVQLRANDSTTWDQLSDDMLGVGYNLGRIGTGNAVYIRYRAKASGEFDCEGMELANSASLTYDSEVETGDTKTDSVTVTVRKVEECEEPEVPLDTCETNPGMEGCQEENCEINPNLPGCPKTCATNPEMEGCQELPKTGPLQITLAVLVVLGIGGGGFYLWRTKKTLKSVQEGVTGKDNKNTD